MPVRVEQRVHRTAAGQAGDRLHQRIGTRAADAAVDQQHAAAGRVRDDVGFAGNRDDEQVVGQSEGARVRRGLLGSEQPRRSGDCETSRANRRLD